MNRWERHHSAETREKISRSQKLRLQNPVARAKCGNTKGKRLSDEHKQKLSVASKRNMLNPRLRAAFTQAAKGKKWTTERIAKRSASIKRYYSDERNRARSCGESGKHNKVTLKQVEYIREKWDPYWYTVPTLAKDTGLSTGEIYRILHNMTWKKELIYTKGAAPKTTGLRRGYKGFEG
jgi:hypothetical protein